MNKSFKIRNKTVSIPLLQGGMGVGISLGNLAGAVAKEGGVGVISSAQIGFRDPDFEKNPWEANKRAIYSEIKKAKDISHGGMVGMNIMVALSHYEDQVRAAADAGADIIISGAGLPMELPEYLKGTDTAFAPIVSSAKAAKVILKRWDKKHHCTADMVVIEGPEAGGHLGFHREVLDTITHEEFDEEVKAILEVVKEFETMYGKKIPVALAGGIDSKEAADHAFSLGVDAIQVASLFVTTEECDADIRYKQAYIDAKKEDIVIVKSPVGMPGRAIRNTFMKKVEEGSVPPITKCLGCLRKCDPKSIPYCITQRLIEAAKGNVDEALLFCGANAYKADKITTVKDVVNSLLGSC